MARTPLMRIGYDMSILENTVLTGVEKYALHLFSHVWRRTPEINHLLFCRKRPNYLDSLPDGVNVIEVPNSRFWRWNTLAHAIRREKLDVFLSPTPLLPRPCGIPMIGVVYECPWRHRTHEPIAWRHRIALWLAALQATRLLTISETSRRDINAELGWLAPPIVVVPPSFDPDVVIAEAPPSRQAVRTALGMKEDRPYCLFVSTIRPKKNVELLVQAFAAPEMADIDLICVGKISDPAIVARATGLNNVHFTGYLPNQRVSQLYQQAEAFLYVSHNEGFGLPILEAFANGCPVIASRKGSIPEVAGEGALYLDNSTPSGICTAIRSLIGNEALRRRLCSAGKDRLGIYSWEQSADILVKIIHAVTH